MSSQAEVHSVEALRDFRAALALYGEDVLAALGAADAEIRRTVQWLQQDRPFYWQEQIKRRRDRVAAARADLFRLKLQKTPEHHPSLAEPKERLRQAEAALQDAEKRLLAVRKWQPALQQAALEYHASVQRLKDLAAADVPRAMGLLARIVEALEAYLRIQPPEGSPSTTTEAAGGGVARLTPAFQAVAREILEKDEPADDEPPTDPQLPEEDP
ncbi:hypothetical protein [Planctomyces sp. SH-PL62]|uniref:hypothetical protein n=1 Tax=Planctomyces sp. SH-PL62 TaxID=1636152 RepID=UPI00078D0E61|nr:hypothetical protein [Planctomyces sp. SH-PL62]AMV39409.1 hypothetical protein VT85_18370 [Planctomyces sp. SH-PL62]